jgi:translocator protein
MNRDRYRQLANAISVVLTIAVNALANIIPFNGQTTGEVSDKFNVYFVPAGYVFAIWGLIYIGLVAFSVYQALPSQAANPRLRRAGYLVTVASAANIIWLLCWHYEIFPLTMVFMLLLLACLLLLYVRLREGVGTVTLGERLCVRLPFSIYLGWITVATVANASDLLYSLGVPGTGTGPALAAVAMLLVAAALGVAMLLRHRDVAYVLVLVWAFVGITVKQWPTASVAVAAAVLAVGLVAVLLLTYRRQWSTASTASRSS